MVKADIANPTELNAALKGAYAVFAVTSAWDPSSKGREEEMGRNIVQAAKSANVQHFIWSTLPNASAESGGRWKVSHFDSKARVDDAIRAAGFKFHSLFVPAFYFQNFQTMFAPERTADNTLEFKLPLQPNNHLSAFDVNDTGKIVLPMLRNPAKYNGREVLAVAEHQSPAQYVRDFASVTGNKARLVSMSVEEARASPAHGAPSDDIASMFGWMRDFDYAGERSIFSGVRTYPQLNSFTEWLKETQWKG
jgi:uncharacterized protein YbjT (DUF2867 family)